MTIEEQILAIEKEIRETPYDKSTQKHHGMLRAKIARLKERQAEASSRKTGGGGGYSVKKQGDATIVLVGPPSAGKSTLINKITNAESKVAPYAFTTVTVIPGMLKYKDAYIQVLDVPGLIEGADSGKGRGKEVLSVVRGADLLVIMTDPSRLSAFEFINEELENAGIRINKKAPEVIVDKKLAGGLAILTNIKQDLDKETIKEVASEFGIKNADIKIREKLTMQTLIDSFARNRVYIPAIYLINKSDTLSKNYQKKNEIIYISADKNEGIDDLIEHIWQNLRLVRVYLVKPLEEPNFETPMIMRADDSLLDLAQKIGTEFAQSKTSAKIWGNGAKFPSQEVSLSTKLKEGMMIRFI